MDMFYAALKWIAAWEVVGLFAGILARAGIPPEFAGVVAVGMLIFIVWKVQSDRFMFDRWRRKYNRWRS